MVDYYYQKILNIVSSNLPVLLLALGFLLLIFCVIWAIVIFSAVKKSRPSEKQGRAASDAMKAPPEEDERYRRLEEIIEAQNQQIDSMSSQLEQSARMRHDFRQELLLLQEFARSGDREALERYLPQVSLEGQGVSIPFCPNPLVNTILQYHFARARAAGIKIDAVVEADEELWLTAGDVGILFGNLLENAVTAAAEAPKNQRSIRLRTSQTKDCFVIALGNTYGAPRAVEADGSFSSTKPDHKGIGLSSIRSVALQYDGEAKFLLDGEMFMSYIILLRPYGD